MVPYHNNVQCHIICAFFFFIMGPAIEIDLMTHHTSSYIPVLNVEYWSHRMNVFGWAVTILPWLYVQWRPTVSWYRPTVSCYRPTVSRYKPTVSRYRPTVSRYRLTVSRYRPTVSCYRPTVSRYRPTVSRYRPTVSCYRQLWQTGNSVML